MEGSPLLPTKEEINNIKGDNKDEKKRITKQINRIYNKR